MWNKTNKSDHLGVKVSDPLVAIIDGEDLQDVLEPDQIEDLAGHVATKAVQAKGPLVHRAAVKDTAPQQPKGKEKPTEPMKPTCTLLYDVTVKHICRHIELRCFGTWWPPIALFCDLIGFRRV